MPESPPDTLDLFSWKADSPPNPSPKPPRTKSISAAASGGRTAVEPLSVAAANALVRRVLEAQFLRLAVVGEISNFKRVASGHHYFTLKDASAQLPVVMFRREAARLSFDLAHGMEVVVSGRLTLYERSGRYQMIADAVEARGAGAMQAAVEALKRSLQAEGLFAQQHKRRLPFLPRTVAVITSATGAVIRDIINVAGRRLPGARILLFNAEVQGDRAPESLCRALAVLNEVAAAQRIDAAIIGRGGGSSEDLWAFNDERLVRAMAGCVVPLVSSVGHESDFTLADLVADVRAPTPSAAAELVFPRRDLLLEGLEEQRSRLVRQMRSLIRQHRLRLTAGERHLGAGQESLTRSRQRIHSASQRIEHSARQDLLQRRLRLKRYEGRLVHPQSRLHAVRARMHAALVQTHRAMTTLVHRHRQHLNGTGRRLSPAISAKVQSGRQRLAGLGRGLDALSPLRVLDRGYSIVRHQDGSVIRDVARLGVGDEIEVWPERGRVRAQVVSVAAEADIADPRSHLGSCQALPELPRSGKG